MQYRKMGRTGEDISVISLGAEWLTDKPLEAVREIIDTAMDYGVNYIDAFMAQGDVRSNIGAVLKGKRDKVMLAGHIGAILTEDGQYERSRDVAKCEAHVEDFLRRTGSEAVDVLMLHFVDDMDDAEACLAPGGLLEAAQKLQKAGKARYIGMSSHVPTTAKRIVDTGALDVVLFNVNPLHDTLGDGNVVIDDFFEDKSYEGITQGRSRAKMDFFASCRRQGTGIVTMKTYAAGRLLAPDDPLGVHLTPVQCIHYALSQAGVCSAAIGCKNRGEVEAAMAYLNATDEERDFSAISASPLFGARGACMYCNHCLPCPVGIDIAESTRILDAAKGGVTQALRQAYAELPISPAAHSGQNTSNFGRSGLRGIAHKPSGVHPVRQLLRALSVWRGRAG
jgi:predicted aldo/keto reductase-like oxidoreductase